ncbi:transcription termination/antitermination NusG family protein [Pluralibacter sp.]|jgi:transcriptional antiterminator RfaH|uniref:transcription termination/antitermination NusG family protein n=1 Tax=Pluralibacter sp. TaxID=1920032 RepID=UPI0025F2A154|nr:transcription termination/antitermination NusG family protein [Pluralibacter sp.]MBV8042109.1 antitermination protein NusG [Pluralibacter sp.]
MENWYLACYKAGKHNAFKAQMFLSQPQIDAMVFIPQICSYRPRTDRPGQLKKMIEPLFPGYMFICFDPEITHTSKISTCPGVSHLVRFADTIKPVNDSIVEEIMQLPVCVHSPVIKERKNKRMEQKNKTVLTTVQHDELMNVVAEKDGLTRSTMLYAFAQSVFE